ncbi:hypothetical protein TNCV_2005111 [Trichonephila clavipes]|nr:hypothetical protein TNCV_2005111 [Trichonephila clavipes]
MVWAGIMINGRTRLHVVANGTMTGQRYIDEVLLPAVRLFSLVLSAINLFYGQQRNMSSNTRCSGLSRQRRFNVSYGQRVLQILTPLKMWGCFGRQNCWSKLSSDKQENPHPCTHRGMG